jgi:phage protein D
MPLGQDYSPDQVKIKVNGSDISDEQLSRVIAVTLESALKIPDMIEIQVAEMSKVEYDAIPYQLGDTIEVSLTNDEGAPVSILKGEITGLEPSYVGNLVGLTVRGYDKSHRLFKGTKSKAFSNVKDSDLASQIASAGGLQADVDATTEVFNHVFQHGQSDFDFLAERASRIGYTIFASNGKLSFKKREAPSSADATLTVGENLISFQPRVSGAAQVAEVTVKGWDIKAKKKIEVKANSSNTGAAAGLGSGPAIASKFGNPKVLFVRQGVASQDDAQKLAQSLLNDANDAFLQAEGECIGNPVLHAGSVVEIAGETVPAQFRGKYRLSSARHEFRAGDYKTSFQIEGNAPDTISTLVQSVKAETAPWSGVVIAIVTDVQDPDNMGRVKLKFPWLSDNDESWWARVMAPGAGKNRGVFFMPEINDEVLVAFDQGNFNYPVVLGGLYNGKDNPPLTTGEFLQSGEIIQRQIKTRTGHTITLSDKSGEEWIEIKDSKGNTSIKLDTDKKKIILDSQGDIEIKAMKNITLTSQSGNIEASASSGNITMKSMQFSAEGQTGVSIKSNATATFEGLSTTVKGSASAEVSSTGTLTIRGTMVMIN